MPRNKNAKRANNHQMMNNVLVTVQKMEKKLLNGPAKLATQLNKQIKVLKKQEVKLNKAVSQIRTKLVKAESRLKNAEQEKNLQGNKKPFRIAKKTYAEMDKTHKALNNKLLVTAKSLESHLNAHLKLDALNKYLDGFDKNWVKQAKNQSKPLTSPEKNKQKAPRKAKKRESVVEQIPLNQSAETAAAPIVIDETVS